MTKINCGIRILNLIVFLIACGSNIYVAIYEPIYIYATTTALLAIKNGILLYSIIYFHCKISSLKFTSADHKLMIHHYGNILAYTMLYGCSCVLYIISENKKDEGQQHTVESHHFYFYFSVFIALAGIFQIYNVLFVFWILVRWTKENERETQIDAVSRREVPSLVFVQNQKMLNEVLAEAKENAAILKKELRAKAEISAWFNLLVHEKIQE